MKKLLALVMALLTVLALVACGGSEDSGSIVENLEKAGFEVEVIEDKDQIAEDFDMSEMGIEITLPVSLIEAENDEDESVNIAVFDSEKDAQALYDAMVELAEMFGGSEEALEGMGVKNNCFYTVSSEELVEVAFG